MSFQAYLDAIKAKTGKTTDDFRALAAQKGLTRYGEILAWLKTDLGLGHGHANAIAQLLANADKLQASPDEKLDAHFTGKKARWRAAYDELTAKIQQFGADVKIAPNRTYINVQRGSTKIAVLQVSSAERFDIGIKRRGVAPTARFEATEMWTGMVSHRVSINDPQQIDDEVLEWIRQAYDAAG